MQMVGLGRKCISCFLELWRESSAEAQIEEASAFGIVGLRHYYSA